jgi:hypothetical protein
LPARRTRPGDCDRILPSPESAETFEGALDHWLLERYRLYVQDRRRGVMHADVAHPP